MRTYASVLAVLSLVIGSATLVQADPTADIIGMYADPSGTVDSISVAPYTPFEVYLLLISPTSTSDIIAWDCIIDYPDVAIPGGNVVVTSWTIAGGGTNVAVEPEFQVAMLDVPPLPNGQVVLLMTAEAYVTTTDQADVYIYGSTLNPLGNGRPTYCPQDWGGDPGNLVAMVQSSGGPELPVFVINPAAPTPVDPATWTRLKGLYR